MQELEHFEGFNEQIFKVYDERNLKNLSQVKFEEETSTAFLSNVLRRKVNIYPLPYSDFKIHDELDFITKDIKYVIGVLYFLKPFIIDTDYSQGTYRQNLEDRRYLMYANFGLQSIYNFWDRIGDILHLYFETGLSLENVYLGRVLNNIKPAHKAKPEYQTLNNIYETHLKTFFNERNVTVHHFQLECQFYWGFIEASRDLEKQAELNERKHNLPLLFENLLNLCFEGFKAALDLINTLPDKTNILIRKKEHLEDGRYFISELKLISDEEDILNLINPLTGYNDEEIKAILAEGLSVNPEMIFLIEVI
ncbi:Cthe_2314 family HEPN domain-containing protein [Pontibacter sp. H249]|uniref:Cthe_2314 family HEPN domain-containing protein n=1 Tax=Pontibacter sp. H249 TaxID=3133420 RepID=UPI0030BEBED7